MKMRVRWSAFVLGVGLLAGCSRSSDQSQWMGYVVARDTMAAIEPHGPYASERACRTALAQVARGKVGAQMVCGEGCPSPRHGDVEACATTRLEAVEDIPRKLW